MIVSRLISCYGYITGHNWINCNQTGAKYSLHLKNFSYHSVNNPGSNRTDESKGGPVNTMKASGGTGDTPSLILNLGNVWS